MRGRILCVVTLILLLPTRAMAEEQDAWLYADEAAAAEAAASQPSTDPEGITQESLLALLQEQGIEPEFEDDKMVFYKGPTRIFMTLDVANDDFRLSIPVAKVDTLSAEKPLQLLKANYEATSHARFAVNHGVVWLVYSHAVSSLSERDVLQNIETLSRNARLLTDE